MSSRDRRILIALALLATALRLAYVALQPGSDPFFDRPMLDGAYYLDWARALAAGGPGPPGAFYLAPLFPYGWSLLLRLFGEHMGLLFAIQHLMGLASAVAVGGLVWRRNGSAAGLAAGALFAFHHPLVFFASRPLSEPVAILLLLAALLVYPRDPQRSPLGSGLLLGLAVLGRPNLLLVGLVWCALEGWTRNWKRLIGLAVGILVVLAPVTLRNLAVSGHPVPVSSNAGLTLYHGNGPGAVGVFTPPAGFSGRMESQRDEATGLARRRSGLDLDPVAADRWWGREAIRTRLADLPGSVGLLLRRGLLLLDNHELALDYDPMLDDNPARPVLRLGGAAGLQIALVPFALLFGLAAAGWVLGGVDGSGGRRVLGAILACAATPLLFYVSSRYRLPVAALLTIPAGCGLAGLLRRAPGTRWRAALIVGAACAVATLLVPSAELQQRGRAGSLVHRAVARQWSGDLQAAETDVRQAIQLDPTSAVAHYNLGVILDEAARPAEAEAAYRRALALQPAMAEAAANLASRLVRRGAAAEAIPFLERALDERPTDGSCWANLVVARFSSGDERGARAAAAEAGRRGVALDPELLETIGLP